MLYEFYNGTTIDLSRLSAIFEDQGYIVLVMEHQAVSVLPENEETLKGVRSAWQDYINRLNDMQYIFDTESESAV